MTGALVGRERELASLEGALEAITQGTDGQVWQVCGEPGIGKTRLLAELMLRAESRGCLVLTGRAAEFERQFPFGVFVGALDDYLAHAGRGAIDALEPWLPELAAIFPALTALVQEPRPVVPAERYRAYRALRAILEHIAGVQPLVLALDDLHWADPASVEAVCHLLAHRPRGRVLVVAAFRPAQTPSALAAALDQAAREEPAGRLELRLLSRDEADVMIGGAAGRSRRDELYRESGGNPFYLEQLLRSGTGGYEAPAPMHLAGGGVPLLVRAALASELAQLSPPARDVLQGQLSLATRSMISWRRRQRACPARRRLWCWMSWPSGT